MPDADSRRSSGPIVAALACLLVAPLVLYFGVFGLLLLDELVLETYYFSSHTPNWFGEVMRTIYWPLIAPLEL